MLRSFGLASRRLIVIATLILACSLANQGEVAFDWDATHVKGIYVNGACILGEDVHTSGIYLIGSADGSDAQGHSVISVGGTGNKLKSDDPAHIVGPPYSMKFRQTAGNKLSYSVTVGPVAQDFATISLPFDFGRKVMDSFSFNGDGYEVFCSENDGKYKGSASAFDFIRPKCEIRDVKGTFIGKVGGAKTNAATIWGQVDGPYATAKVTVTSSNHYDSLVFMNHPGTHNLEFSFGKVAKGETVAIAGEIEITPKAGPATWTYDAAPELNHQIGRAEADGWSVHVGDEAERYMCFGPYASEVGVGPRVATFKVMLDDVTFDNALILTVDVADSVSGTVLAKRDLTRGDFHEGMRYEDFSLPFTAQPGARLEFRTLWHGASYAREKSVTVSKQ
jgi:hypothetical protein